MGERGLLILLLAGFCVPTSNQIIKHMFVKTVKSWSTAQSYCRMNHIELATVHSQEEAKQLLNIAGTSLVAYAWIGMYRDDTQNWQWSNGDDVIYSNWRADVFCASVNSEGKWIDLPCHLQRAFICYQETSNITERYTLIEVLKTWTEAQQYCREYHTDLVSIKDASENEDLVKKAQGNTFWIGLFNEPWKWSHQGDSYTFHYWNTGQPDNRGGNENCVVMGKTGGWYDTACSTPHPSFCCVGGSSGQCFYVGTKKTWQDAQSYCRNQGRDLPTIQDKYGVNKLIGIIPKTRENNFWIGLYHDKENWQWSNGDDIIYSNWDPYLFCASVNSDGEWEDSVCSEKKAFICYNETSIITERYTLIEVLKTWTEAQQYCREHHTDLVSIKDASENADLVKKAQGTPFWIGLFNEPWKWSHQGDNYTFHYWNTGQPDNWGGNENCVVMGKTGGWCDTACSTLRPSFCCDDATPSDPPSTQLSEDAIPSDPPSTTLSEDLTPSDPPSTQLSEDATPSDPPSTRLSEDAEPSSLPSTPVSQAGTPVPVDLHLISDSMVWPEAWQYCKNHYTDLVSLTSLAAQNRVSELVRNSTASRFWTGLHRTVVYDNWYWVAGKDKKGLLNYTNWAPGEPNNPYYEHCGEMVLREDGRAEWNDLCCYEKLSFICFKDQQHP
ncbi:C-type mannose receptor 2-like isoform X1 [Acipenser ruthenus]|uniref:C-type mannose receptor 2-like isoform X2 n=1 Tax=Acipenser ruthenus TaxID=7906 RepID=UPI0027426D92|nr:C-type mannose receptor 2-like isoform X2 [Acipenser ruthenus]XP_058866479.1 C-type mannose receptor 2-like isoform X1 [Acipenser ruthenus]XP_058866480.1 C-type mannose receptor 2-like isoform X1 [Acipenser ruthenus]XP_058866481.1 C-type mannose receptor 2-like isoform X1 [Acipenser ruthenus]XP_058866482.1 C-type mannose receptor 2-like isoform X1 [Acipenser ruthenus]